MRTVYYDAQSAAYQRSLAASPNKSASISGPPSFDVYADDGTKIPIPMSFLSETAEITVSLNDSCSQRGTKGYIVVQIINRKKPMSKVIQTAFYKAIDKSQGWAMLKIVEAIPRIGTQIAVGLSSMPYKIATGVLSGATDTGHEQQSVDTLSNGRVVYFFIMGARP